MATHHTTLALLMLLALATVTSALPLRTRGLAPSAAPALAPTAVRRAAEPADPCDNPFGVNGRRLPTVATTAPGSPNALCSVATLNGYVAKCDVFDPAVQPQGAPT